MTVAMTIAGVECYRPGDRHNRTATWSEDNPEGRWRSYSYDEIINRDGALVHAEDRQDSTYRSPESLITRESS